MRDLQAVFREDDFGPPSRHRYPRQAGTCDHYPADDASCKALIQALGNYDWALRKTPGGYSENPYKLQAHIGEVWHTIHLPLRKGTVVDWLREIQKMRGRGEL